MTTYPLEKNDPQECDCEDCRLTRALQGLVDSMTLAPMGILVLPSLPLEVDVSNSGDLDRSYEDGKA